MTIVAWASLFLCHPFSDTKQNQCTTNDGRRQQKSTDVLRTIVAVPDVFKESNSEIGN